eukprot:5060228-Pyramimonas_sp.AAC.1
MTIGSLARLPGAPWRVPAPRQRPGDAVVGLLQRLSGLLRPHAGHPRLQGIWDGKGGAGERRYSCTHGWFQVFRARFTRGLVALAERAYTYEAAARVQLQRRDEPMRCDTRLMPSSRADVTHTESREPDPS